jgi:hypothetical protein
VTILRCDSPELVIMPDSDIYQTVRDSKMADFTDHIRDYQAKCIIGSTYFKKFIFKYNRASPYPIETPEIAN